MKVLVCGIDSDIGYQIYKQHQERGDEVLTTSRNKDKNAHFYLELVNRPSWPQLPKVDKLYYTIGIPDGRNSRFEVMNINAFASLDFARYIAANKITNHMILLSSMWGSISNVNSQRAIYYRMSKAALNMGISTIKHQYPDMKFTLMHPGLVKTKMTENIHNAPMITTEESAKGIIEVSSKIEDKFAFVDYLGNQVQF